MCGSFLGIIFGYHFLHFLDQMVGYLCSQVNIFACDEWAVYSSRNVDVVPGFLQSTVVDSDLKCDMGGEFGSSVATISAAPFQVIFDDLFHIFSWFF